MGKENLSKHNKKLTKIFYLPLIFVFSSFLFLFKPTYLVVRADQPLINQSKKNNVMSSNKDSHFSPVVLSNRKSQRTWQTFSPDKSIISNLTLRKNGSLKYSTYKNGKRVILNSSTGLITNIGNFSHGLKFFNASTVPINDSFSLKGSKFNRINAVGNQLTLNFKKRNVNFSVIFRSYNNGVALRYLINKPNYHHSIYISQEKTGVKLPINSQSRGQSYNINNKKAFNYQPSQNIIHHSFTMPFLYQTPEANWVLLSEAGLNGTYSGSRLLGQKKDNLVYKFIPEQKKDVKTNLPFSSPWRFAVIGSPRIVANNMMSEILSPSSKVENSSWIQSGTSGKSWLNGGLKKTLTSSKKTTRHQISEKTFRKKGLSIYKNYINAAAKNGWKYQTLNEGWQPKNNKKNKSLPRFDHISNYEPHSSTYYHGYYKWTGALIRYAQKKGIKLIVWLNSHDLRTSKQRQRLNYLSRLGVAGFKIYFSDPTSQSTLQLLDKIYKQTAKDKTVLSLQGLNEPTGEERTWPQVLNREAITASDLYSADDSRNPKNYGGGKKPRKIKMTAKNNLWLSFTRGAVGPTDYSPVASYNSNVNTTDGPKGNNKKPKKFKNAPEFTLAHMTALPIVFQGGIEVLGDKPSVYRNSSAYQNYWKNFPSQWNESKILDGTPGSYISVARRHVKDWYVGMIGAYKYSTNKNLKLNFLKPRIRYKAYIFQDNPQNPTKKMDRRIKIVTNKSKLNLNLVSHPEPVKHYRFGGRSRPNITASGGAAIKFQEVGPVKNKINININRPYSIREGDTLWSISRNLQSKGNLISIDQLANINHISNRNLIYAGNLLFFK